ncbi:polycystin-1-like isoform X2 [Amphiura filiformis]|uniref:polycystin-1-like isoform X2 n=1 Tax=Amphiura filiformis TaxID=82378 RepID=UPI003B21CA9F
MAFDAAVVRAEMAVDRAEMDCPLAVAFNVPFMCTLAIYEGSDIEAAFDINAGDVTRSVFLGSPTFSSPGTCAQSDAHLSLQTDLASDVAWAIPAAEFLNTGRVIAFEVFVPVVGDGQLDLLILAPTCTGTDEWCPTTNTCGSCNWTPDNGNPLSFRTCSAPDLYCIYYGECVTSAVDPCPAAPSRLAMITTDPPRVDYGVVASVTRTVTAGYNWLKLDDLATDALPEVQPGYIVGFKTTPTGAQVGYESFAAGDNPVEFEYAGVVTTEGNLLTIAQGGMGQIKKHHVRAIASQPVMDTFEHVFSIYGNIRIEASLTNSLTLTPVVPFATVGVLSPITGLTVSVDPMVIAFGDSATLSLSVASGSPVNYIIDWGDGNEESVLRQATSFDEADTITHPFSTQEGDLTINVTATNLLGTVSEETTITVLKHINRAAFSVTSNSPQVHPCFPCLTPGIVGNITFTVTVTAPDFGTDPLITLSSGTHDNSTDMPLYSLQSVGDFHTVDHSIRFPGVYDVYYEIYNQISKENFYFGEVSIQTVIQGFAIKPRYLPEQAAAHRNGHGPTENLFPVHRPVYFVFEAQSGSGITITVDDYGDGTPAGDTVSCESIDGCQLSHKYASAGTYTITMTATNDVSDVGSPTSASVTITIEDNIKCITVTDVSIGVAAGEEKLLEVDISSIGTDSCLAVDYENSGIINEFYGHQPTCADHPDYDAASWISAIPVGTFSLSHIYTENGSYKCKITGFNRVSETIVEFPLGITPLDCTVPILTMSDHHANVDYPKKLFKSDPVQLESFTQLICPVLANGKRWKIEPMDCDTKAILSSHYLDTPGNPYYNSDATNTAIRIPPRSLSIGCYKFTFEMTIDSDSTDGVVLTNSISQYCEVESAPLIIRLVCGQTTGSVVGYGDTINMYPQDCSSDPNLPVDADHGFADATFEYYCKRSYETLRIGDDMNLDPTPIPIPEIEANITEDMGGCYSTGAGRLDHSGGSYQLRTIGMKVNVTYDIIVKVYKGNQEGTARQRVTIKEGTYPQPTVTCTSGTLFETAYGAIVFNPTADMRLKATCTVGCERGMTYDWIIMVNNGYSKYPLPGWQADATGLDTPSLWIPRSTFGIVPNATSYEVTVLMTNEAGYSGKSHVFMEPNEPPRGGSCSIPSGKTSIIGGHFMDIECRDWEDDNGIESFKYYVTRPDYYIPLTLPVLRRDGGVDYCEPPAGTLSIDYRMALSVQIRDKLGALTTHKISDIEVRPNGTLDVSDPAVVEKIQRDIARLNAEGNSRDINTKLQTLCAQLNDVREIADSELETLVNDTEAATTKAIMMEWDKELRAYIRRHLIDMTCQYLKLNTMQDIQIAANSLSVCTMKTDEISQQTLDCTAHLISTFIDKVFEYGEDTDQETIVEVLSTVLDVLGKSQEGTYHLTQNPLTMNDKIEAEGGDYDDLLRNINDARGAAGSITTTWKTTTALIDDELRAQKNLKTSQIADSQAEQSRRALRYILKNKISEEPMTEYRSDTITCRVARSKPADVLKLIRTQDEDGGAILPEANVLFANSGLDEGEEIDIEASSTRKNFRNYDASSKALSDDTEMQSVELSRADGSEIEAQNLQKPVEIKIARKQGQIPEFKEFDPVNNTDKFTGMSCHSFDTKYDRMAITLDFIPFAYDWSIRYEIYFKYGEFATQNSHDLKYDLNNESTSYDATNDMYSFFVSDDYVANNTGKYYLCVREVTKFEGLDFDVYNETNNFTGPYTMRITLSGCRYWNKALGAWTSDGLQVDRRTDFKFTICLSTHLSSFASSFIVPPTPLDFNYIFANAGFAQNLTIYITTIVIYVLFFFVIIWGRRKDKKDVVLLGVTPLPDNNPKDKYYYEMVVCTGQRRDAGTESKVSFILSGDQDETDVRTLEDNMRPVLKRSAQDRFLLATSRPLGTLNYMRLWHDNSGVGPNQSWYLQYIAIRDLQTRERFYFIVNNWFSLVEGDGEADRLIAVAGKEQMQSFDHVFYGHTRKNLNDGHIWFSIFARPAGSRFTRCQRAACCMMLLWLEMLVNIMYYKVVPPAPASNALSIGPFSLSPAQVSIGVQSAIIVFPVSLLVVQLFRKARPRKKRVSRIEAAKKEQPKQIRLGKDRSRAYVKKNDVSASAIQIEERSDYAGSSPRSESRLITDPEGDERPVVNTTYDQPRQKNKKKKASKTCPWWTTIIAWIVVILVTMMATTFTIFYGIQFGNETTSEWLASFVVTTITGILFTQPIKVIAMAIFIALVIKTPNADEDDDMEDDEEDFELGKDEEWLHGMSDAPVRRKIAYIPPDPDRIARIREKRIKELAMYAIIREIILYIIFLWILMMISYGTQDPYANVMKEQYANTLVGGDGSRTFDKIVTIEQYWAWVHTGLVPSLYAGKWYNGDDPEYMDNFFGDRNSFIVGYPVMRQVRVRPDLCNIHEQFERADYISECNVGYSMSDEDEGSYEAGWIPTNLTDGLRKEYTYTTWDVLDGYPFFGRHAVYIGGGYVSELNNPDTIADQMQQLEKEAWIDRYTRAVFVEFSTYNAQVNLFAVVNLVVEFLPSGGGFPYPRVDIVRLLTYYEGFALVQICCEAGFLIFIVFFIVKEIKAILKQKREYPKVFWNLAEWVIIAFSIGLIIVYFYRFYTTKTLISAFKKNGGRGYVKLQYVAYWNELLGCMIGWVVFMSTLKFIKLLRFNKRIGVLSGTIRHAANDLIWFGMFFAIVFLAYSVAFYLILGTQVFNYSDFTYTMESLITAILGKFAFYELVEADRILGPLLFFAFMCTITFILINMFLTIITEAFQIVKHDVSQQSNDYEMVDFMMTRFKAFIGIQQAAATLNPKDHEEQARKNAAKDDMEIFTDKVDQLLNHIAKVYFDQDNFDNIIKSMGQGKQPAKPKNITPITA